MLLIPLPADRLFEVGSTDQRRRRALLLPINGTTAVLICALSSSFRLSPRNKSIPISHSLLRRGCWAWPLRFSFVLSLPLSSQRPQLRSLLRTGPPYKRDWPSSRLSKGYCTFHGRDGHCLAPNRNVFRRGRTQTLRADRSDPSRKTRTE